MSASTNAALTQITEVQFPRLLAAIHKLYRSERLALKEIADAAGMSMVDVLCVLGRATWKWQEISVAIDAAADAEAAKEAP